MTRKICRFFRLWLGALRPRRSDRALALAINQLTDILSELQEGRRAPSPPPASTPRAARIYRIPTETPYGE